MMAIFNFGFIDNFQGARQSNNFENRSIFSKDAEKSLVARLSAHGV